MPTRRGVIHRLQRLHQSARFAGDIKARTGRDNGDGSYTLRDADLAAGQVYVRSQMNPAITWAWGSVSRSNLHVILAPLADGSYRIDTPDFAAAVAEYGEAAFTAFLPVIYTELLRFVLQSENFAPGRVRLDETEGLVIYVDPFFYTWNGQEYWFTGDSLDLGSPDLRPATAGTWLGVKITHNPVTNAISATAGAAVDSNAAIDAAYFLALVTPGERDLGGVRLREGQTTALQADGDFVDLRAWLDTPNGYASLQTTNNTQTTLISGVLAEDSALRLKGQIVGVRSTYGEMLHGEISFGVRRATGGNITLVGAVTTLTDEDSSGSPSFTADVDTGTQSWRVRVTGETSKTFNWSIHYTTVGA